jgi:hypothetical protein
LEEGQVCTCSQAQADAAQAQSTAQPQSAPQPEAAPQGGGQQAPQSGYQQAPQAAAAPSPVGMAFKNLIPFCKSYLRSPTGAARAAIDQKDLILAIILLAIQAIAAGLAIFALLTKVCILVKSVLVQAMTLGGLWSGSSSSLFGGYSGPSISASFPLCLVFGILAAAIAIVVFAALIFAVAKIMKSACTFRDVITACGAHSPFVTVLLLLAFLLFFASIRVGLVLFVLAMLTWVALGVPTAQAVTPGTEQGKFWMLYIAAVLVAVLIGGWCGSKFFGMSVGATKISYAGESITVSRAIDSLGDIDFEDLMEDLIYDIF